MRLILFYSYLQYQRAINGFLRSLFARWREEKCSHEVNIIFFARHLYNIDELLENQNAEAVLSNFPKKWRNHVQELDDSYVYIDFYRSVPVDATPGFRADTAAEIITKCREIIINWKKNSELKFDNGAIAPKVKEGVNDRFILRYVKDDIRSSSSIFTRRFNFCEKFIFFPFLRKLLARRLRVISWRVSICLCTYLSSIRSIGLWTGPVK